MGIFLFMIVYNALGNLVLFWYFWDYIKSNKINTYEMLYDANEMIKQAEEAEAENDKLAIQAALENPVSEDVHDTEAEALLDDPEEMIKLLKKRRGI